MRRKLKIKRGTVPQIVYEEMGEFSSAFSSLKEASLPHPLINLLQSRVGSVLLLHLFKIQKQLILFVRKERPFTEC